MHGLLPKRVPDTFQSHFLPNLMSTLQRMTSGLREAVACPRPQLTGGQVRGTESLEDPGGLHVHACPASYSLGQPGSARETEPVGFVRT